MKTAIKLLALLLCLVMLVPCLAACDGEEEPAGNTTGDATADGSGTGDQGTESGAVSETETDYKGQIAVEEGLDKYEDLGGYTYKAYVRSGEAGNGAFACEDFWVESVSRDPLAYAVYQRNADIEAAYNCKIRQIGSKQASQYDEMKNFYLNSDKYELSVVLAMDAAVCATSMLLQDVLELDNIYLENTTYDQNSVVQFTMGGKLYYFSGDMNISPLDCASVTIFNTALHEDYDFDALIGDGEASYNAPYEMVADGDWTVENMMKMAKVVDKDMDNTGGVLDATQGDYVGYFQYSMSAPYYWYSCGARLSNLTEIEDGGYPEIVFDNDKGAETYNLLYDYLNTAVKNPHIPVGSSGTRKNNYGTGYTLFTDLLLWDVRTSFYTAGYKYGILPTPKADVDQERYFDVVWYPSGTAHLWSIPAMCSNKDYASFLLNAIAVYSARPDNTMDAYYTKTLELSVAQDAGSRATLKIVRDNVTYDICILYDWGGFIASTLNPIASTTANRYGDATTQDAIDRAIEEMEKTLEGFREPSLPDDEVAE